MRLISMVCIAALAVPALSAAQAADSIAVWPLTPGLRVRVLSPTLGWRPKPEMWFRRPPTRSSSFRLRSPPSTAISTPKIARIEVAQGKHTRKLQGALLGLFVGAGAGAILASATYKPPKCAPDVWCIDLFGRGGQTAPGGMLGGLLGLLVGTIVGSHETDNWVPVAVPTSAVAVK